MKTARAYAAAHLAQMRALQRTLPDLAFRDPWPADGGAVPWASGGKWVVTCPCGDYPMASPDWDEARCFSCGGIYTCLQWPPDRLALEAVLVQRQAHVRAWVPGETVDDLRVQNVMHGAPVGR